MDSLFYLCLFIKHCFSTKLVDLLIIWVFRNLLFQNKKVLKDACSLSIQFIMIFKQPRVGGYTPLINGHKSLNFQPLNLCNRWQTVADVHIEAILQVVCQHIQSTILSNCIHLVGGYFAFDPVIRMPPPP